MKFCKAPFTDLVISLNKRNKTVFSPCCYNYSKYAWFESPSIREALSSCQMEDFRRNAYANSLKLCSEDCIMWEDIETFPKPESQLKSIALSLSNECNIRCCFCGLVNYDTKIRPDILEEFKNEFLPKVNEVNLSGGEPLLCARDLILFIMENYPKIKIGVDTNGILLGEYIPFLKHFNKIHVSLNAGNPSAYRKISGVDSFDKVLSNIKKILSCGFEGCLSTSYVLCRENIKDEKDVEDFLHICLETGIKNCGIVYDTRDPFLNVPPVLEEKFKRIADRLNLNLFIFKQPQISGTKKIKQAFLYYLFYIPRQKFHMLKKAFSHR